MTLLIAGSRRLGWALDRYCHVFDNASYIFDRTFDLVISGGARGVDKAAELWATRKGYPFKEYPADWDRYGKGAGYIRNKHMVEVCDAAILLWDGSSFGTGHTKDLLEARKPPVPFVVVYA